MIKPPPLNQIGLVAYCTALSTFGGDLCGFLVNAPGETIIHSQDAYGAFLASANSLFVFLMPALGAIVLGTLSDAKGRKFAMVLSFVLLGVSTSGLALTPPYSVWHENSSLLFVGFHALECFANGGQIATTIVFIFESAPEGRKGLYTSIQTMAVGYGTLISLALGYFFLEWPSHSNPYAFGLRAFALMSALNIPLAWILWRRLQEAVIAQSSVLAFPKISPVAIQAALIGLAGMAAIEIVTFAMSIAQFNASSALRTFKILAWCALGATVGCALAAPLGGWLSDRFGRKRTMTVSGLLMLALLIPAFVAVSSTRSAAIFAAFPILISIIQTVSGMALAVALLENLPQAIRSRGYALARTASVGLTALILGPGGGELTNGAVVWFGFLCFAGILLLFKFPEGVPQPKAESA